MEALTVSEDLKYQLETLSTYEPNDIDNPEFEVGYENASGNEGFATVCCVDVAKRALERIKELEESISDSNTSAFGDGWYDGFLDAQKLAGNERDCLEEIKENKVRDMSEHAESIHAELKTSPKPERKINFERNISEVNAIKPSEQTSDVKISLGNIMHALHANPNCSQQELFECCANAFMIAEKALKSLEQESVATKQQSKKT
jgi:hypothetical protein